MPFPLIFGASPFGGDLREQSYELIRRLEGRGAYSKDPDSAHDREVLAEAEMHVSGRQAGDRLALSILPDGATELLLEWEDAHDVPNTAARNVEERQRRATLFKGLPYPAHLDALFDLYVAALEIADPGSLPFIATLTPDRLMVTDEYASPECIYHVLFVLTEEQYETQKRLGALDIFERVLPAHSFGSWTRENALAEMIVTRDSGALWGGAGAVGRVYVGASLAGQLTIPATNRAPARFRDYGPMSRLAAADLNGIQDAILFDKGQWGNTVAADFEMRYFDREVPNATTVTIDSSIDWRDRMLFVALGWSSSNDVRITGASDHLFNGAVHDFEHVYSGTGGASYERVIGTSDLFVRVNSATGALELRKGVLGGTRWVNGMVIACGDVGGH